jgi:antitoxin component YwqK of YwqJK toxin-antitoxin module
MNPYFLIGVILFCIIIKLFVDDNGDFRAPSFGPWSEEDDKFSPNVMNINLKDYAIPIEMTEKKDGRILFEDIFHNGYIVLETHSNKKPKIVAEVKKGIIEGELITNYNDGQIKAKSFIKDDKLHGNTSDYYISGELETEGCYEFGKKIGVWKSYYKNGKIRVEEEYYNDKPDGYYKKYDKDGNLISDAIFVKGILKKEII